MPDLTERTLAILAVAGHDLNNHLTVSSGCIAEALDAMEFDDPSREYLVQAKAATERCSIISLAMTTFAAQNGAKRPDASFNFLIDKEGV